MATNAQSGQPVQVSGLDSQLSGISQILSTLFGNKNTTTQTSNPGNTDALTQLLSQLQGADYNSTLQSIFQQAGGQIPGLMGAFTNAVGARSGGNSAVQAALSKLMQDTAIQAQAKITDQQLQNQQLQGQAGTAIAQTTKGTTQTAANKTAGQGKELASIIALLQGAKMLTGSKDMGELAKKFGIGGSSPTITAPQAPVTAAAKPMVTASAPVTGAQNPFGVASPNFADPALQSMQWTGGAPLSPDFNNFSDMFASQANDFAAVNQVDPMDALMQVTGGFGTMDTGSSFLDPSALDNQPYQWY